MSNFCLLVNGTLSTLDLIKASLHSRESVHYHGDSRYLLILSENCDAALDILQNKVLDPAKTVVIFGSSFPKDQEYTQVIKLRVTLVQVVYTQSSLFRPSLIRAPPSTVHLSSVVAMVHTCTHMHTNLELFRTNDKLSVTLHGNILTYSIHGTIFSIE